MSILTAVVEAAGTRALPVPAFAVGLISFGILLALLFMTLSFGKGRPHT